VLLLVVLAMLAMFVLLALSFVVITGQARRGSEALNKADQYEDPPEVLLNEGLAQVLRGSNRLESVLYAHSLLEDVYGSNTYTNNSAGAALAINPGVGSVVNGSWTSGTGTWAQLLNLSTNIDPAEAMRRVGCVLTITNPSSAAAGASFRIVGYDPTSGVLQVYRDGAVPVAGDTFVINGSPFSGTGQGFNPTTGQMDLPYTDNPADPRNAWRIAILPRPFANTADYTQWKSGLAATSLLPGILSEMQMNEDYDAADYQNMLLAMALPGGQVPVPSLHRPELVNYWYNWLINSTMIPWGTMTEADRRRAVLQPWGPDGIPGTADDFAPHPGGDLTAGNLITQLKRKIILRPSRDDHPNFTGSNPYSSPTNVAGMSLPQLQDSWEIGGNWGLGGTYLWDVDNDGDGVPDSIWVDLGFPARSTKDGRLYKPLVAILCTDMDGRLNVNAHGNYTQANRLPDGSALGATDPGYYDPTDPSNFWSNWGASPDLQFVLSLDPTPKPTLLRGLGYGPADVNLLPLFGGVSPANLTSYFNLLQLRYGSAGVPGSTSDAYHEWNKWFEFGGSYWSGTAAGTGAYGSPPNRLANGAIALDAGGRPLYCGLGWDAEKTYDPHRMNLVKPANVNAPFTVAELEGLLRQYDADAGALRSRLVSSLGLAGQARSITTESWDIPSIPFPFPEYMTRLIAAEYASDPTTVQQWLSNLLRGGRAQDVLTLRYYFQCRVNSQAPAVAMGNAMTWSATNAASLLPFELLSGRPMDINRPFGNGADDSAAGSPGANVLDEPLETMAGTPEMLTQRNASGTAFTVAFNHTNQQTDSSIPGPPPAGPSAGLVARQLYARHLYVLAMLLMDTLEVPSANPPGYPVDSGYYPAWASGITDARQRRVARARWLAQWAVNVVDFRDRDSIMTRFDFDPFVTTSSPYTTEFHAWSPTETVWGCERPELLISETLAIHARRVEDLTDGSGSSGSGYTLDHGNSPPTWYPEGATVPPDWDPTFDQRVKPQGSLFIELYNPQSALEPRPAELCNSTTGGVQLNKTVTDSAGVAWPVWRLLIASPVAPPGAPSGLAGYQLDPDDENTAYRPTIERAVYFTARPATMTGDGTVQFYTTAAMGPIGPGRYAVIGPGTDVDGTGASFVTCFGRTIGSPPDADPDPGTLSSTRRIVLTPGTTGGTPVASNGAGEPAATAIQPVTSIVINSANPPTGTQRMNVSEPDAGYPAYTGTGVYSPPLGTPLDYGRAGAAMDRFGAPVNKTGITQRVSIVYLQRLADPTRPYDPSAGPSSPNYNPYRTIDSAAIDLVAFNGWDIDDRTPPGMQGSAPSSDPAAVEMLAARQRGDSNTLGTDGKNNLWVQHLELLPTVAATPGDATATHYFNHQLRHSLGYLTVDFSASGRFTALANRITDATSANRGDPNDAAPSALPWLTWNNRPFISPLELLLVPPASSSRLLNVALAWNAYGTVIPDTTKPVNLYFSMDTDTNRSSAYGGGASGWSPSANDAGPFPHLMNLFRSSPLGASGGTQYSSYAPRLYQLLSFLTVPSPFVGTELPTNPTAMANTAFSHLLYPPFNLTATYREPGRVNLNTIYGDAAGNSPVWQGVMNDVAGLAMGTSAFYINFASSRRGSTSGNWWDAPAGSPTRFANPFRSASGAQLNPVFAATGAAEVQATLLRPDPTSTGVPLFGLVPGHVTGGAIPDCLDTSRNPFFRYQTLARLGNLVTTRSNVYAVWITVGYFEVQGGTVDAAHPDGCYLGRELGSDTGEIQRHRAFYLIDRSIPVGFQRGKDLNVGNTVLLKRFIE
jgi:hypothetical protein